MSPSRADARAEMERDILRIGREHLVASGPGGLSLRAVAEGVETQAQLDSGIRIADVGADGQKRYLNDAERAQRSARANAMAAECR